MLATIVGLAGGLALFLFGMDQLVLGLKSVAGSGMRVLLARLTTNRLRAVLTGAFVTGVIQSSSVTTVLLVGLLSAGVMTLPQAIGIIFGANIGSTVTAQLIAFRLTDLGLVVLAAGFVLLKLGRAERLQHAGRFLLGLGLVFYGMTLMSEATAPLRGYPGFVTLMEGLRNPAAGIAIGAVFTAVVQSSAATTGIAIVLASQGLLPLEGGIALVLGANIGTCVTALLAALGKPAPARQAAAAHVLFNIAGTLLWLGLIGVLASVVRRITPDDPARQLANAHTTFNVVNALLFVGFTGPIARLIEGWFPDRLSPEAAMARPRYLDASLLATPDLALDAVRRELGRMARRTTEMVELARPFAAHHPPDAARRIRARHTQVAALHEAVVEFLSRLARGRLDRRLADEAAAELTMAHNIENVADTVHGDLLSLMREATEKGVVASPTTRSILGEIHREVLEAWTATVEAMANADTEKAFAVIRREDELRAMTERAMDHLLDRLGADAPLRAVTWRLESDVIELRRRIFRFAKNIARAVVESS